MSRLKGITQARAQMLVRVLAVACIGRCMAHVQLGIDFNTAVSVQEMQCLQGESLFFITRIFDPSQGGQCDPNGSETIRTADGIGYGAAAHAYLEPDPESMQSGTLSPQQQVDMAVYCGTNAGLPQARYAINVLQNPAYPWPQCTTANEYVVEMVKELWHYSDVATVFTSKEDWTKVTCQGQPADVYTTRFTDMLHAAANEVDSKSLNDSDRLDTLNRLAVSRNLTALGEFRSEVGAASGDAAEGRRFGDRERRVLRLWYLSWDGKPNFQDFDPFGPFKTPYAKQYAHKRRICGVACNQDVDGSSAASGSDHARR